MRFDLTKGIEILSRTPSVLDQLLSGLSKEWINNNEGEGTWSPYDVLGHLIHGEKTDWIPRAQIILSDNKSKNFEPFDRFAQMNLPVNKTIQELLIEFKILREENLRTLSAFELNSKQLELKGIHPEFGEVTLSELLATWVAHDLGHIGQIVRVMAKQYKEATGPWTKYLRIVQS